MAVTYSIADSIFRTLAIVSMFVRSLGLIAFTPDDFSKLIVKGQISYLDLSFDHIANVEQDLSLEITIVIPSGKSSLDLPT